MSINRHGGHTHQRSITCAIRIGAPRHRVSAPLKKTESCPGGYADIKACAGARILPLSPPPAKTAHKVHLVEIAAGYEGFSKTKRHGCIVGPLTRPKVKWTSAHHVCDGYL